MFCSAIELLKVQRFFKGIGTVDKTLLTKIAATFDTQKEPFVCCKKAFRVLIENFSVVLARKDGYFEGYVKLPIYLHFRTNFKTINIKAWQVKDLYFCTQRTKSIPKIFKYQNVEWVFFNNGWVGGIKTLTVKIDNVTLLPKPLRHSDVIIHTGNPLILGKFDILDIFDYGTKPSNPVIRHENEPVVLWNGFVIGESLVESFK